MNHATFSASVAAAILWIGGRDWRFGIPVVGVNSEGSGILATVWWENNLCGPGSPIVTDRPAAENNRHITADSPLSSAHDSRILLTGHT